jgi:hypothetical protein
VNKKQLENRVDYLTVVVIGLVALLVINYAGDFTYRGAINEHVDSSNQNFQTLSDVNNINVDKLNQIDEVVRSNMKVIDQLIGIILRGDV